MHNKHIFNKIIPLLILLLMISTGLTQASPSIILSTTPCNDRNILYVGGSGLGNYTTIQDAIDNATNGDTVYVYSGEYIDYVPTSNLSGGCVIINKQISLLGENKHTTIINADFIRDVVKIRHDNVIVRGFTIKNSGKSPKVCAGVEVFADQENTTIHNNIITNNYQGIDNYHNSYIDIHNNTISHNSIGIDYFSGDHGTIHHNTITHNAIAIELTGAEGNPTHIHHNTISNNTYGITPTEYRTATIEHNNFINNSRHVTLFKSSRLLLIPYTYFTKQIWTYNYWDDWTTTEPYPITGTWRIYMLIPQLLRPLYITLINLPYKEYDNHPTPTPNIIP